MATKKGRRGNRKPITIFKELSKKYPEKAEFLNLLSISDIEMDAIPNSIKKDSRYEYLAEYSYGSLTELVRLYYGDCKFYEDFLFASNEIYLLASKRHSNSYDFYDGYYTDTKYYYGSNSKSYSASYTSEPKRKSGEAKSLLAQNSPKITDII